MKTRFPATFIALSFALLGALASIILFSAFGAIPDPTPMPFAAALGAFAGLLCLYYHSSP